MGTIRTDMGGYKGRWRVSKRIYKCAECGGLILRGESYYYYPDQSHGHINCPTDPKKRAEIGARGATNEEVRDAAQLHDMPSID